MDNVILDSNVFILFLVGQIDPDKISSHKKTSIYTKDHYEYLLDLITPFDNILICPNITTEIDNHLNTFRGDHKRKYLYLTRKIFKKSIEQYTRTVSAVNTMHYDEIGITDSVILLMAKHCDLLVSGDSKLCDHANAEGINLFDFKNYVNETTYR